MRHLITLLLLTTSFFLTAQSTQYVWAKSGLTLRVAGHAEAEKIGVIPFGKPVELTGNFGSRLSLPVFEATTLSWGDEEYKSRAWALEDSYVEVVYKEQKGWVFAGYLFRLPTPVINESGYISFSDWLVQIGGMPDTIYDSTKEFLPERGKWAYQYDQGITKTVKYTEGGGTSTYCFPLGSLNDGYLISEIFFSYNESINQGIFYDDVGPSYLVNVSSEVLHFEEGMGETIIMVVGNMLIIISSGWC